MSVTKEFYLARAEENARDAEGATLANVRERCLRAEAAWRSMADRLINGERLREAEAVRRSEKAV